MSLAQKKSSETAVDVGEIDNSSPSLDEAKTRESPPDSGTLLVRNEEISYIDSSDWRTILQEVSGPQPLTFSVSGARTYVEH